MLVGSALPECGEEQKAQTDPQPGIRSRWRSSTISSFLPSNTHLDKDIASLIADDSLSTLSTGQDRTLCALP